MARAGATVINSGSGSIGQVRQSLLSEAQFQAQNGSGWVLADGRNVAGSKYTTVTGATTVPDCRGVALRGKNNGRADGFQNPDGELALGALQDQATSSHRHRMAGGNGSGAVTTHGQPAAQGSAAIFSVTGLGYYDIAASGGLAFIENTGGNETRGRNVTVNTFIKIN